MNEKFNSIIDKMPKLQKQLDDSSFISLDNLVDIPISGIYVFFENEKPIYVGRSNRMRDRLREHFRPSSTNYSAPFAFNIAKKQAVMESIDIKKPRKKLEKDSRFHELFMEAKRRVSKMSVKVIQIEDPVLQAIFEIYASIKYETQEYNDFETH